MLVGVFDVEAMHGNSGMHAIIDVRLTQRKAEQIVGIAKGDNFKGVAGLVSHMLEHEKFTPEELVQLRLLIERHTQEDKK